MMLIYTEPGEFNRYKKFSFSFIFLFLIFPILTIFYKPSLYLNLSTDMILLILKSLVMFVCHINLHSMVKLFNKNYIFILHLIYFVFSGVWTYANFWYGSINIWFMLPNVGLMFYLIYIISKYNKPNEKKVNTIISLIFVVMVFGLIFTFDYIKLFRSFLSLKADEIECIGIYNYEIPFEFRDAEPEMLVFDKEKISTFCTTLEDIIPFSDHSRTNKSKYLVSIYKKDGTDIVFSVMKQKSDLTHFVLVAFIPKFYLKGNGGLMFHSRYTSRKMVDFFNHLDLKNWNIKIE